MSTIQLILFEHTDPAVAPLPASRMQRLQQLADRRRDRAAINLRAASKSLRDATRDAAFLRQIQKTPTAADLVRVEQLAETLTQIR